MTEVLERILDGYGQAVRILHGGGEREAKAFLQAMEEPGKAAPYAVSPLGFADDRRWRCISRAALADGDRLDFAGRRFRVRNARAVYLGGELCHYEAVLTAEREAAECRD